MNHLYEQINRGKAYVIAEMSANHAGSLKTALQIVRAAKAAGADCLKIQTYTADTMTIRCDNEYFRIKSGLWQGKTLYELYRQAYTPWEWHGAIKEECDCVGLDFLSTPFDKSAVDFLEGLGAEFYKIASFELTDTALLAYVAAKGKPVILSCGLASPAEIAEAQKTVYAQGNRSLILLKCCSAYPAGFSDMRLAVIADMKERFGVPVGISDHSKGSLAAVAAVSMGACVVEKHFCLSKKEDSPDSGFSMEPDEFARMVREIRAVEQMKGRVSYALSEKEQESTVFRRSVFAVSDIHAGEPFTSENIRVIRPGYGLPPKYYQRILGLRAGADVCRGEPILFSLPEQGAILFLTNNDVSLPVYDWLRQRENVLLYDDRLTADVVDALRPSFIVSYNYRYMVGGDVIRSMEGRIINLHISLLPWNRGASPNFFSFYDNTPKGVTIHAMDEGLDTGDVLCRQAVDIDEETETFASSYRILHRQIQALFYANWEKMKSGMLPPQIQEAGGTTHTVAELQALQARYPFGWNDNIARFKQKYNLGGNTHDYF